MRANVTSVNFLSAAVLLYGALAGMPAAAQSRVWNFQVALDDTPIGYITASRCASRAPDAN